MSTYYKQVGIPNGGGNMEAVEGDFGVELSEGIVSKTSLALIDGTIARTNRDIWRPRHKTLITGIAIWLYEFTAGAGNTPPTISIGSGSSGTDDILLATVLTGLNVVDEVVKLDGEGVYKFIEADTPLNFIVTSAANYTTFKFVPMIKGMVVNR